MTQATGSPGRRFQPYPAYKDSGVDWLGQVPRYWDVKRLKFCARELIAGGTPDSGIEAFWSSDDGGIPWVVIADITAQRVVRATQRRLTPEGFSSKRLRLLPTGTLIYSMYASLGKTAVLGLGAATNQAILGIIPQDAVLNRDFLARWFERMEGDLVHLSASNTQDNLSTDRVREIPVFLPPLPEQRAIAAFLDRKTAKIDALVTKKERLIALLEEKRAALISRAVTRGLDPSAPMKESGVEGLEQIPAHWEVMKTTWLFTIGSGTTPKSESPAYYGGEVPWVTTSELRESVIVLTEKTITEEALRDLPSLKVHPKGSVALAMYGATIGRLGILGVAATVNQACCVFSNPKNIDTWFWFYWLQMRRSHLISLGYGGGQPNLSQELLRSIRVPTPPLVEQRAIAAFLDRETTKVEALVTSIREAVDKLREYRTALISAAVTGKIDVREGSGSRPVDDLPELDER